MLMNNILLDMLPDEWNGYEVNTWFQVGIQIFNIQYDRGMANWEKTAIIIGLLFSDEDGNIREHPDGSELSECISWYLNGWFHDKPGGDSDNRRLIDYDVDQWRIYADFLQIYRIDLNKSDMHFWEFMGLLWNMPYKYSSFMQVIDIRKKEIKANMSAEEKKSIREAQKIYGLQDSCLTNREYSEDEKKKIDDVDALRQKMKQNRK